MTYGEVSTGAGNAAMRLRALTVTLGSKRSYTTWNH